MTQPTMPMVRWHTPSNSNNMWRVEIVDSPWLRAMSNHCILLEILKNTMMRKESYIIVQRQNPLLGPRTIRIFHTWSLIIYFEELSPSTFIFFFIFVLCSLRMSNWRCCCLLLSCKSISQPIIYCELDRLELNFTVDCELYQAFDANCLFLTAGLDIFFVQMCFYNSTEDDSIFNLAFWVNKGWK